MTMTMLEFTIERDALLKAVSRIQGIVERRNTIPILSNLKVSANEDGSIIIVGTDLDMEVVGNVAASVGKSGCVTVSSQILFDILRKLQGGSQVKISSKDDDHVELRSGRSRFTLSTLPAADFPQLSKDELPWCFSVPAHALRGLIDRTRFAISTEETRYYLNGIYLHVAERDSVKVLRSVATDGHRLAMVDAPAPLGSEGMPGVIVPRKTVGEIRKLIDDAEDDVAVGVSDTQIMVDVGGSFLTSKLIDGTFPDYDRVIPSGSTTDVDVPVAELASAVSRVSAVHSDRSFPIKIDVTQNGMHVSSRSDDHGEASDDIDASMRGDAIAIGFNGRYLIDILDQDKGSGVSTRIMMTKSDAPAVFRTGDGGDALYVLMPMRVGV